ncbi:MAG: hypothetical protein WD934_04730 [Gemmatimonadales bacterium]
MNWLRDNWFWLGIGILFVWVHARMHAGHHRHGHAKHLDDGDRAGHPRHAHDHTREDSDAQR